MKILIVEDDKYSGLLLGRILENLKHEYKIATNGSECLRLATSEHFNLILLDNNLPGEDGIELLPQLFDKGIKSQIIMITGTESVKLAVEAMRLGAIDYIVKPFHKTELIECISRASRIEREIQRNTEILMESKIRAEEADRAKSAFLAQVSHEMRTPLHNILSNAELGEARVNDPQANKYFQRIVTAANRQLSFINEILDIAKIEAGKMAYHFSPNNISTIINDQILLTNAKANEKQLKFDVLQPENIMLNCDKKRIGQVILNLIANAIKFSEPNSMISIRSEVKENLYYFSIKDQGPGINNNEIELVFEKFHQSDNNKEMTGTGLGLSIAKSIVSIHKGTIWVENNLDRGCTFFFSLPTINVNKKEPKILNPQSSIIMENRI